MQLNKNMGTLDRIIRIGIAVVIAVLYFSGNLSGLAAIILGILAVIFVLTSIVSFCPLYLPFGISTCKK
jgi:amino acid transporter